MNPERPHEIVEMSRSCRGPRYRRWVPLTEKEAALLRPMTEDQRAEWFAALRFIDRYHRFIAAEKGQGEA